MRVIYSDTRPDIIKSIIDYGEFKFYGRVFYISQAEGWKTLSEKVGEKVINSMKIYPEENLYRTVLKHIGFDMTLLEKQDKPKEKTKEEKEKEELQERQKEVFEKLKKFNVMELDVVCYFRKSVHSIGIQDIGILEGLASRLESGEIRKKDVFPISNRSLKNYSFNIGAMYPKANIKRVIHHSHSPSRNIEARNYSMILFLILYIVPAIFISIYVFFALRVGEN